MMEGLLEHLEEISLQNPPDQWDWSVGVGVLGVVRAHRVTGDRRYIDFLKAWIKRNSPGKKMTSVNHVIPAFGAMYLWELGGEDQYRRLAEECAEWCLYDALRTGNGGLAHVWDGGSEDFKNQLWIDTVYMSVIYLMSFAIRTARPHMLCEAVKQLSLHIGALLEPESGLFYHGYHCLKREPLGCFWGRGNGWMAAALADCAELLEGTPYRAKEYWQLLRSLCRRAYEWKSDKAMLRTVLNRPDSYEEMTATMLFGYAAAKGCRFGWLEPVFYEWAADILELVGQRFTEKKYVAGCSAGTDPSDETVYMSRPFADTPFADGIALSFLSEMYLAALK